MSTAREARAALIIDDCAGSPCLHGGACTDGHLGFTCACLPGRAGLECQWGDAEHCNGGGTASGSVGDDALVCTCDAGSAGDFCQYSDAGTCSGGGTAQQNGTCTCDDGFAGAACQFSDVETCSAHGRAGNDGACSCDEGWDPLVACSEAEQPDEVQVPWWAVVAAAVGATALTALAFHLAGCRRHPEVGEGKAKGRWPESFDNPVYDGTATNELAGYLEVAAP